MTINRKNPWESKSEFSQFFDLNSRGYYSVILIADSIGAFFSMNKCAENGWYTISMKNDFLTMYGNNVVKNSENTLSLTGLSAYTKARNNDVLNSNTNINTSENSEGDLLIMRVKT